MSTTALEPVSLGLPPGPYAHLPGSYGDQCSYDLYCTKTGELFQSFIYCDGVHLAEMDAFVLATALNASLHGTDPTWIADDPRRSVAYQDFRRHFPGEFVVRNISIGKLAACAICCSLTEHVFCRITCSQCNCDACVWARCFCDSLNLLTQRLDLVSSS